MSVCLGFVSKLTKAKGGAAPCNPKFHVLGSIPEVFADRASRVLKWGLEHSLLGAFFYYQAG
jgi:hypothetical protein